MAHILILIMLQLGSINGIYLGEFESEQACQQAAQNAAMVIDGSGLLADVEAAGLLCVPKAEA